MVDVLGGFELRLLGMRASLVLSIIAFATKVTDPKPVRCFLTIQTFGRPTLFRT